MADPRLPIASMWIFQKGYQSQRGQCRGSTISETSLCYGSGYGGACQGKLERESGVWTHSVCEPQVRVSSDESSVLVRSCEQSRSAACVQRVGNEVVTVPDTFCRVSSVSTNGILLLLHET